MVELSTIEIVFGKISYILTPKLLRTLKTCEFTLATKEPN